MQLEAAAEDFWRSPKGLTMRLDSLAQDLHFQVVNGAMQMVAPTNGVKALFWRIADDDKVCWKCIEKSLGGDGAGFYRAGWFYPKIPVHPNCRCQLELVMDY
jgi:hypothetical protein